MPEEDEMAMNMLPGKTPQACAGRDSSVACPDGTDFLLPRILPLAVRGLQKMFDPERQRFCFRAVRSAQGIRMEGVSDRYTMICLLGLARMEKSGRKSPVDVQKALSSLLSSGETVEGIGDLGLLLWLCALASPDRLPRVWSDLKIWEAISRFPDALQGRTVELSWFLSGIAHTALARVHGITGLEAVAEAAFREVLRNYGGRGIFYHIRRSSLKGLVRGRLGCFADQAYPIFALSKYYQAFGSIMALDVASECAEAICRLQGPLGQWWWHYDAETGRLIGRYPVFSVHQDGMAPMALYAVGEASGRSFHEAVFNGLKWIAGKNELSMDMIDPSRNVIWRSIYRDRYKLYASGMASIFFPPGKEKEYTDLKVLYECWSYHLGWLLYAFSDADSFSGNHPA